MLPVGRKAMEDLTTGDDNTAVGNLSMLEATTANYNTCMGYQSGRRITTARTQYFNWCSVPEKTSQLLLTTLVLVLIALRELTTGADNTAVGREALQYLHDWLS